MNDSLPRITSRRMQFEGGSAIGTSNRWEKSQYCSILTRAGIVGCGVYDMESATTFDQAIAVARGTPANPLVEPEDLLGAKIVDASPKARSFGIEVGMTGREATEIMLAVHPEKSNAVVSSVNARHLDHVTIIVEDLERSRRFYTEVLGMQVVERPGFSFDGMWLNAGGTQVHLILDHPECADPGYPNMNAETLPGRVHHFAFEVEDAYGAADRLKEHGVRIQGGPVSRPDGCIQVWFFDPDDHIVEVFHKV
ncbi:MAG: DUF1805 domain-containing protein [Fuerstiella sp.]|nr:DUF1805 domain-containing protein [Fuerstiella sp.]